MIKLKGQVHVQKLQGKIYKIAGEGSGGPLQAKTVYPSHDEQIIAPDEDYYGLVSVTVKPVPRLPFASVSFRLTRSVLVENVVNIGAVVSVTAEDVESNNMQYTVKDGYYISDSSFYKSSNKVTYFCPVESGKTYTITMTEVGNRLYSGFSTVGPDAVTDSVINGVITDLVNHGNTMSVGYEFTYTASADGWLVLYVSSNNEHPTINITA